MIGVQEKKGAVCFFVSVAPRSSKCSIVGEHDGSLKVSLKAPPVEGRANGECVALLAKALGVARSRVVIVSGARTKKKRIQVDGLTAEAFTEKIRPYL